MVNDEVMDTQPAEFEKLRELGENIVDVDKPFKVKSVNDLGHEKGKDMEIPLTKIPRTPPLFPYRIK